MDEKRVDFGCWAQVRLREAQIPGIDRRMLEVEVLQEDGTAPAFLDSQDVLTLIAMLAEFVRDGVDGVSGD